MITKFKDEHRFLSSFFPAPITYKSEVWPTAEHAYQAEKFNDPVVRKAIREAATPGKAKRMGKAIPMRADWDEVKVQAMMSILLCKFMQHPDLLEKLKATGEQELVEGNDWHDTFWGVCQGKGQNNLGKILMRLRTIL